jgi:hypothetical protein
MPIGRPGGKTWGKLKDALDKAHLALSRILSSTELIGVLRAGSAVLREWPVRGEGGLAEAGE